MVLLYPVPACQRAQAVHQLFQIYLHETPLLRWMQVLRSDEGGPAGCVKAGEGCAEGTARPKGAAAAGCTAEHVAETDDGSWPPSVRQPVRPRGRIVDAGGHPDSRGTRKSRLGCADRIQHDIKQEQPGC